MTKAKNALTSHYRDLFLDLPPFPGGYKWAIKEVRKTGAYYLDLSTEKGLVASTLVHPDCEDNLAAIFITSCAVNHGDVPPLTEFPIESVYA
jgi:hypothetical protein